MQATVAVRCAATDGRRGGVPGVAVSPGLISGELLAMPVLIIEDEAMIAWMLESLLEDMGFKTLIVVASGEDALAAARRDPLGLIVSDINLGSGRLDGVETAATLRTMVKAPILFVTGMPTPKRRHVCVVNDAVQNRVGQRQITKHLEMPRILIG